jgi:histidinol phosphatase-like enzyme
MRERFEVEGAPVTDVFYCPYHPEHGIGHYKKDSLCRKPNPGMLLHAAKKHGIDLRSSIMIGDKDSDMQAASRAGVGVRCHYLAGDAKEIVSDLSTHKIHSLRDAVFLLSGSRFPSDGIERFAGKA